MARRVRFWDLAASGQPTADFTAGVRMACEGNLYYVEDPGARPAGHPLPVNAVILQTARLDGRAVEIVIEQEPGASGVSADRRAGDDAGGLPGVGTAQHGG